MYKSGVLPILIAVALVTPSLCVNRIVVAAGIMAGAAQRDVTPPVGFDITHYVRKSIGVHDPLYARALVLDDGAGTSVAIVCTDFIGAGFEVCDALRETIRKEIGIGETLISCSHSHSSIGLGSRTVASGDLTPLQQYNNKQNQAILDIVAEAKANAVPVTLRVGRADAQVGFNRRLVNSKTGHVFMGVNQKGPVVPWVNVLVAESKETKKPVAVLLQHSAHPVIVPHTSGLTSADYPGAAVKRVREELGDDVVVLFGQGCGGNINGFPLRTTHENADKAGRKLGEAALKAMKESDLIKTNTILVRSATSDLPSNKVPTQAIWQSWVDGAGGHQGKINHLNKLKKLMDRGENPPARRFDAYAVMLGRQWCLVTMPHEMFCQYELWIDKNAPFDRTMTFAYTNGGQGYIAVDEAWAMKEKGGYEAGSLPNWGSNGANSNFFSPPAVGSEAIIKETIASMWPKVKEE